LSADLRGKVLQTNDRLAPELLKFAQELIKVRSVTGEEGEAQSLVRDKLKSLGASIDYWKPRREDFKGYEAFVEEERNVGLRPNVVGRFRGRPSKRVLAFNGHIDVVPEGDPTSWRYPPFEARLVGGRLFGRGACDMKAGLAAVIFAIESLLDSGVALRNDILVESVVGEESGGLGTLATIRRGYVPDGTIIAEPTNLEPTIIQAGCLMFRLTVRGKAAHGASRYMGVSAVEKFQPILLALQALEKRRAAMKRLPIYAGIPNPVALSIGKVRAGDWDSTVPESLVAEGRYGVWPRERLNAARSMFETAVATASSKDAWLAEHPPQVSWFGPQWESAGISSSHWLTKFIQRAFNDALHFRPKLAGITGGTDMRLFTRVANKPAILFGPGDSSVAHFRDEHVEVASVIHACKVYSMAALAWNE
jgi:acetylornithine deacetylase